MAFDAYLKIEGIDGESRDAQFKGSIEVESFSWGVSQTVSHGGGGGGAGKATFQDMHFTAHSSKASPSLFIRCASGKHIAKATLFCRKAGGSDGQSFVFVKIEMLDVLVSSYQNGGSAGDDTPMDGFSLNFGKIEFDYAPQSPTGTPGAAAIGGVWDVNRDNGGMLGG